MKSRIAVCSIALTLGVGLGACGSSSRGDGATDPPAVSSSSQDLIAMTGNVMMFPAGPIAWNGMVGTWPIAVWSPAAIGGLAFDVTGVSNLAVTSTMAGMTAAAITTPFLNAFNAGAAMPWMGAAAPVLGATGFIAPGFAGAWTPFPVGAFGFGAFGDGLGFFGATVANGVTSPFLTPFLTPTLTSSALMFNNVAMTSAMMPLTFNVTFTAAAAQSAALMNTASLSLFATPIMGSALTAAAIPFSSMAFPIAMPLAVAAPAAIAPIAPVVAAPVVAAPVVF